MQTRTMTDFKPEKIIPFIRIMRKLRLCDTQQQLNVLQQLPRIFDSHGLTAVLREIIFSALFQNIQQRIPATVYDDIESILPSDNQLKLRDSISESHMVESVQDSDEEQTEDGLSSTDQEEKTLPLTLLRIPTDLQYHLFHFLYYKDLMNVQGVCRALCISARNPCSIYCLHINPLSSKPCHFENECYSRPGLLSIRLFATKRRVRIITNTKWSQNVSNLSIQYYDRTNIDNESLGIFVNLEKCEIVASWMDPRPYILLNGQIASYYTLRVLSLKRVELTEEVINSLRQFKNLEILSLAEHYGEDVQHSQHTDLVVLPQLKQFSFSASTLSERFNRILIGSCPVIVNVDCNRVYPGFTISQTDAAVRAFRGIKSLSLKFCSLEIINALQPVLRKAKSVDYPFIEECTVSYEMIHRENNFSLCPIITLFECSKTTKLHMSISHLDASLLTKYGIVTDILHAGYGTFNEVTVHVSFAFWMEKAFESIKFDNHNMSDGEAVKNAVMENIEEAEKWMKSWLIFDEQTMKQIGLRKLDIKFEYDMDLDFDDFRDTVVGFRDNDELQAKADRFETVLKAKMHQWIQERVAFWSSTSQRCTVTIPKFRGYQLTLSLRA